MGGASWPALWQGRDRRGFASASHVSASRRKPACRGGSRRRSRPSGVAGFRLSGAEWWSISDRLLLPFRSPAAANGRRSRGGPLLPTASHRSDLADLFSLELFDTADRSAGPLVVVNYSCPSRRAIARGPLLSNRERFERRFVGRSRIPLLRLLRAKNRRLTFEKGPAFADSWSGDCRRGTHTKGPAIADTSERINSAVESAASATR